MTRKQQVHEYFGTHGYEETVQYGLTLGLKESTIRRWMVDWKDERLIYRDESKRG